MNSAPEGWKLVPVVPDEKMGDAAANEEDYSCRITGGSAAFIDIWHAMLDAAPEPPAVKESLTAEPAAWVARSDNRAPQYFDCEKSARVFCGSSEWIISPLYSHPPAEQRPFDYADAYQGAREDLAIWKRRALEAERRVRKQDQIIDRMSDDLNAINGPTFMGEPVLLKRPAPDVSALVEALEEQEVKTIDDVAATCGMFYGRYQCSAAQNDAEGMCHTFGCPLAEPMDDEDEQWGPEMEGYHYMLQHSKFAGA